MTVSVLGGSIAFSVRIDFTPGIWIGAPLLVIALAFVAIHLARTDSPGTGVGSVNLLGRIQAFGYKRRLFEVLLDLVLAMVALLAAFLLRFDGEIPEPTSQDLAQIFPVIIVSKVVLLYAAGAYDGVWRYAGLPDLVRLIKGAVYGSAAAFVIAVVWLRLGTLSRGALLMDAVVYASLLAASRIAFRVMGTMLRRHRDEGSSTRLLVWGAGDMGAALVRKLLDAPEEGLVPVGFIDDDPAKRGRKIHGIPVLGPSSEIDGYLRTGIAERVLLASEAIIDDRIAAVALTIGKERLGRIRLIVEDLPRLPAHAGDA